MVMRWTGRPPVSEMDAMFDCLTEIRARAPTWTPTANYRLNPGSGWWPAPNLEREWTHPDGRREWRKVEG